MISHAWILFRPKSNLALLFFFFFDPSSSPRFARFSSRLDDNDFFLSTTRNYVACSLHLAHTHTRAKGQLLYKMCASLCPIVLVLGPRERESPRSDSIHHPLTRSTTDLRDLMTGLFDVYARTIHLYACPQIASKGTWVRIA